MKNTDLKKSKIKFKIFIGFKIFLVNLKYEAFSIFKLKFRDFDLNLTQHTFKQIIKVDFDKIIFVLENKDENYQIFYSNNNKDKNKNSKNKHEFFEMNFISEQLENSTKTVIDIKIDSTTLNIKKKLFLEAQKILEKFKKLKTETSFNPNLNVKYNFQKTNFQKNLKKTLQKKKKQQSNNKPLNNKLPILHILRQIPKPQIPKHKHRRHKNPLRKPRKPKKPFAKPPTLHPKNPNLLHNQQNRPLQIHNPNLHFKFTKKKIQKKKNQKRSFGNERN